MLLALLIFVSLGACACSALGQNNVTSIVHPTKLGSDINATNWEVRMQLAEKLSADHTEATFKMLLVLLNDKSDDVSYAAAEAIEARKDKAFDHELIAAIKSLSRDDRWPAYRAAKNYPTPSMLDFLQQSLEDEIQFRSKQVAFDTRNCFYISHSLEEVVRILKKGVQVAAPEDDDPKAYAHFAQQLREM